MENQQKNDISLPSNTDLFKSINDEMNNYFVTKIIEDIKPKEQIENKEEAKFEKQLEEILICCICYKYLDNPVNDPSCCKHYACKKCFDNYFKIKKAVVIPCPLCRRSIKKKNLVKVPLFESIIKTLQEAKNNKFSEEGEKIIEEKCEKHPRNDIFYICLDCKVKMCPICNEERMKHNNHHIANYERYIKLINFFEENFANIRETISKKEKNIKEYSDLIEELNLQKNAYLNFLNDVIQKIKKVYDESEEKLNKIISESMKSISKLRNFMKNIKIHISNQFTNSYNDIDNLDEIEEEIKKSIKTIDLKSFITNNLASIKKQSLKNLFGIQKIENNIRINKKILFDDLTLTNDGDSKGIYLFGVQLSDDKTMITAFLKVKKMINNIPNESSYIASIEYKNETKRFYLEQCEINDEYYIYKYTFPLKELFDGKVNKIIVKFTIFYLSIK